MNPPILFDELVVLQEDFGNFENNHSNVAPLG
jgi:hypothetical protein